MDAVVVTADDDLCKVTFNIGDLPECDYIEYIDWGDNSAQEYGPFVSGDMPMHVYVNSGTYVLTFLAIERDPISELICFEKFLTETITLQCDTCACQSDLTLQIGSSIYPVSKLNFGKALRTRSWLTPPVAL
jgi:hypothetical protein